MSSHIFEKIEKDKNLFLNNFFISICQELKLIKLK